MRNLANFRLRTFSFLFAVVALSSAATLATIRDAGAITIQAVRSPAGVTAWLVEDYTVPIISMRFAFDGGSAQDPAGKEGLSNLMTGLFDEGAGDLDAETFQDRLDVAAAEMSFSASGDSISGSIRMLADTRNEAISLLALAVNKPRFDEAPFQRIRAQIISGIRAGEKRPETIAGQKWAVALYGDHPYARDNEGTPETLEKVTRDDLRALHGRVFAHGNLHVGVVGAINAGDLAKILDQVFGDLPEKPQLTPVADVEPALGQTVSVDFPQPQTSLRLAYPGLYRDDPRFFSAYLMNHILGGGSFSSRLYDEVREKRGLVYGIGSYLATWEHSASLGISTSTRSDRAAETLHIVRAEVSKMATVGPTEDELARAKKYVLGAYAINNLDSSAAIARTLVGLQQEKLGIDYIDRRERLIADVTLSQVRDIARELLSAEPAVMAVGPDASSIVNGKM